MNTSFDMVKVFHKVFGHPAPAAPDTDALADRKLAKLRVLLVAHELIELAQALAVDLDINYMHASMGEMSGKELEQYCVVVDGLTPGTVQPNIVLAADAFADLDYVVNGGAIAYGINLPQVTAEVHASNMSKLGADGQPILDPATNKVIKGPNYREPDIGAVLLKQTTTAAAAEDAALEKQAGDVGEPVGGTSPAAPTSASSGSSSSPTTASTTTGGYTPADTGASAGSDKAYGRDAEGNWVAGAASAASASGATTTTASNSATASKTSDATGEPSGELKAASTTSSELAAGTSAATAENAAVHTPQGETPSQRVAEILGEADDGHDGSVA